MPFIDDRGRLFGRVNLIDAAAALLVCGLMPLGYGAYALFRVPVPVIVRLQPTTFTQAEGQTLDIIGVNLRPFLRVSFGVHETDGFLVQSASWAEVKVPAKLAPGTYDVVLYDESQELVRRPRAITVTAGP